MWNDTDIPLAVFFTFRCYGTWLHGDGRGSVDRNNNKYGSPRIPQNSNWRKHNENLLLHPPVALDAASRKSVEKAIRDLCEKRGWKLLSINIRTNHVHVVISIGAKKPKDALIALKANATRQMREDGLWPHEHSPWADKGSKRNLWNETSIWEACNYVNHEQGDKLPDFDWWGGSPVEEEPSRYRSRSDTFSRKNPVAIARGSDTFSRKNPVAIAPGSDPFSNPPTTHCVAFYPSNAAIGLAALRAKMAATSQKH